MPKILIFSLDTTEIPPQSKSFFVIVLDVQVILFSLFHQFLIYNYTMDDLVSQSPLQLNLLNTFPYTRKTFEVSLSSTLILKNQAFFLESNADTRTHFITYFYLV